jgi:hypothetical protein
MADLFGADNHAIFSPCRQYRNILWRIWDRGKPAVMFIGLNPSTANETEPDATIKRVIAFAKRWGYGGVYMTNLFTYVSSEPDDLLTCTDPLGEADTWLEYAAARTERIIFAWGNFKQAKQRAKEVEERYIGYALLCNKNGSPRHPLFVKGDAIPFPYRVSN